MLTNQTKPDLVCPAGGLPALKVAVDNGADCVYIGLKDETNARNFSGLNFDMASAAEGIRYAHARGRKVLMAINTFPQPGRVADPFTDIRHDAEQFGETLPGAARAQFIGDPKDERRHLTLAQPVEG